MAFGLLVIIGALVFVALYSLSDGVSNKIRGLLGGFGGVSGAVLESKTSFSDLVLTPALNGDILSIFAVSGVVFLALVLVWNSVRYGSTKAAIR